MECGSCGKEFKVTKDRKQFCSRKCAYMSRRKVARPGYDDLLEEVTALGYLGTGQKYGVSDNTVRSWLTQYRKDGVLFQS